MSIRFLGYENKYKKKIPKKYHYESIDGVCVPVFFMINFFFFGVNNLKFFFLYAFYTLTVLNFVYLNYVLLIEAVVVQY